MLHPEGVGRWRWWILAAWAMCSLLPVAACSTEAVSAAGKDVANEGTGAHDGAGFDSDKPDAGSADGRGVSDALGDCATCALPDGLTGDGRTDAAGRDGLADGPSDAWYDVMGLDGAHADAGLDAMDEVSLDVPATEDGVLNDGEDDVAEDVPVDLSKPDTLPQEIWDNSAYTPVGEPFPIVGFGAATKGGWQEGHDVYHVTSLADSGPGTLREGLYTGNTPRIIVFDLDGTIPLSAPLLVPSNITIDGRGRSVTVQGKGFVLPGSDEVIFINLALEDVGPDSEDGFQIGSAAPDPSENVVLDHVRMTQHGDNGNAKKVDEGISIIFGSRNITIAWCRFEKWEKVLLAGNGDAAASLDGKITLTWHHSYAWQTGRRHPQARYGKYHLFNNFWDDWYMYGSFMLAPYPESFGCQIQDHGRMLLEGMLYRRHEHGLNDTLSTANEATRCESSGDLLEYGTWVVPDSSATLKFGVGCAQQQAFAPPYEIEPETAGPTLRDKLLVMTGNTL